MRDGLLARVARRASIGAVGTVLVAAWALAQPSPVVSGAWARATPPGARTGAIYLEAWLDDGTDRLVGASSPAADEVQLHTHVERNGLAEMQRVEAFELAADRPAVLAPGGDHLMLIGLKQPLVAGTTLELTLRFERAGELALTVPVVDPRAQHDHEGHGGHRHEGH